jgi:RHS repeat-associated protein
LSCTNLTYETPNGQAYSMSFSTDHLAIAAGGPTFLEYRTTHLGSGPFPPTTSVSYRLTLYIHKVYEPRDVLVTICDEKDNYRFGFNGMEKDNEVKGIGNTIDMGDRWLDTRLGRTPKTDLHKSKYPFISPYTYAANSPIAFHDPDGKDYRLSIIKNKQVKH